MGPTSSDVHPDAPASAGVRGSARYHRVPGSIGHISALYADQVAKLYAAAGKGAATTGTRHFEFKPRVTFVNESQGSAVAGVSFPKELNKKRVPGPNYVTPTEMIGLLKETHSGKEGSGLTTTPGLTTAEFKLTFDNLARQWQQTAATNGAPQYKFLGGDVYLEIVIAVHVQDAYKPDGTDKILHQMFKLIYEHELEHVIDEIDIITNWLPSAAYKDEMVKKHLTDQPIAAGSYNGWIASGHLQKWLHDHLWADEHNRRAAARDSDAHYAELNRKIDRMRRQRANPNLKL